jgi:hypothetical protein
MNNIAIVDRKKLACFIIPFLTRDAHRICFPVVQLAGSVARGEHYIKQIDESIAVSLLTKAAS